LAVLGHELFAPARSPHFIADALAVFKDFNAAHLAGGVQRHCDVDQLVLPLHTIDDHRPDHFVILDCKGIPRAGQIEVYAGRLFDPGRLGCGELPLFPFKRVRFRETKFLCLHGREIAFGVRRQHAQQDDRQGQANNMCKAFHLDVANRRS